MILYTWSTAVGQHYWLRMHERSSAFRFDLLCFHDHSQWLSTSCTLFAIISDNKIQPSVNNDKSNNNNNHYNNNFALQPDSLISSYLPRCSAMFGSPPPNQPLTVEQSCWGRPGTLADKAMVESTLSIEHEEASFFAASAAHSGDWLLVLPMDSV